MKRTCLMIVGLFLVAGAQAAGKDALWEITTKMDMPDMPKGMTIPGMPGGAQKQTVCLAEGKKYESKEQQECKVLEQKQSGRKHVTKIKCKEGTMTIEHDQISKDLWRSKMVMSGEHEMTVNTEGKRIGACDASQEGGMSRETQKMMGDVEKQSGQNAAEIGKMCQKAVADWPAAHPFGTFDTMFKQRKDAIAQSKGQNMKMINTMHPEVPHCAKAKVDYCNKSKATAKEMGTRKGYVATNEKHGGNLAPALQYCGVEVSSLLAGHCKGAVKEGDYNFVAGNCSAERKVLAEKFCPGRSYTATEPKYQPLCSGSGGGGGRDYTAEGSGKAEGSAVDQGMKKLKGLFGGSSDSGSGSGSGSGREDTAAGTGNSGGGSASGSGGSDANSAAVQEGVKKLKGLFGF